jgi:hypothetical protein
MVCELAGEALRFPLQPSMILVHPPVAKPCEPPAGVAKLLGALDSHGARCKILDANVESLLHLLHGPHIPNDSWTHRASRNLSTHLTALRSWAAYGHLARYKRAVLDLNHLLQTAANSKGYRLSLANYQHPELSPIRSVDLIRAAERPEENPFYPYLKKRLRQVLEEDQPSVLGFSLNYLSQALCTFAMIGFLRRDCPGIRLALGGGLVTSWVRRPSWRNPFQGLVDALVAGPGEYPLLGMMNIVGGTDEIHSRPNYDPLPLEDYFAPGRILPYSSSSGCYWNRCLFCPERAEGNPYTPIPVDRVMSDLNILIDKMKPVLIHLLDNAIPPPLMEKIASHPPGVPWYGFARISPHLTDLDFCRALKESGCVMLQLGLESGDPSVLDAMQKGIDLRMASQALKTLRNAGIATYVYLLFGTPMETSEAARKTLEFIVRHHDQIRFLNLAVFNQPVFGPEAQKMETKEFYEGDLTLYTNFSHPRGWDRNLVRQFLDKEFKRHPAIAPIVRRDPPIFTSNHAPFFVMEKRPEAFSGR